MGGFADGGDLEEESMGIMGQYCLGLWFELMWLCTPEILDTVYTPPTQDDSHIPIPQFSDCDLSLNVHAHGLSVPKDTSVAQICLQQKVGMQHVDTDRKHSSSCPTHERLTESQTFEIVTQA